MRGIKLIIIVGVLGAAAFAGAFFLSRQLGVPKAAQAGATAASALAGGAAEEAAALKTAAEAAQDVPRIEEKHLYDLIKEVRQKILDCQKREQALDEAEKRLAISHQLLDKEAQDLEALRIRMAAAAVRSKEAQAELEKTRVAIDKDEVANLKRVAAVYDKMDPTAAGRILEGLCAGKQDDDAAKILHYMTERSVAKVLAELTDKRLAARLVENLKRIKDQG